MRLVIWDAIVPIVTSLLFIDTYSKKLIVYYVIDYINDITTVVILLRNQVFRQNAG